MLNEYPEPGHPEPDHPELERLSAYLDDELSLEERAQTERLLATSAEARRELAELERLRELLRTLPLETLSDTFPALVLHQGERRMLLDESAAVPAREPHADSNADPDTKPHARRPSRRARWMAAVAGAAALATALVVALRMDGPSTDEQVADRSNAELATHSPEDATYFEAGRDGRRLEEVAVLNEQTVREQSIADRARGQQGAGDLLAGRDRLKDRSPSDSNGRRMLRAEQPAPGNEVMADLEADREVNGVAPLVTPRADSPFGGMAAGGTPGMAAGGTVPADLLFDQDLDLKTVEPGQVVRALSRRDGRVAVVRLTVVDRQRVLEELQLLLKRHDIPLDEPGTAAGAKPGDATEMAAAGVESLRDTDGTAAAARTAAARTGAGASGVGADEFVAVFVEAPGDRLQSAFEDLQRAPHIAGISLGQPVTVAMIEPERWRKAVGARAGESPPSPANRPPRYAAPTPAPAIVAADPNGTITDGPGADRPSADKTDFDQFNQSRRPAALKAPARPVASAASTPAASTPADAAPDGVQRGPRGYPLATGEAESAKDESAKDERAKKAVFGPAVAQKSAESLERLAVAGSVARQRRVIVPAELAQLALEDRQARRREQRAGGRGPGPLNPAGAAGRPQALTEPAAPPVARLDGQPGESKPGEPKPAELQRPAAAAGFVAADEAGPVQLLFVLVSEKDAIVHPAAPTAPAAAPAPPGDDGAALERSAPTRIVQGPLTRG